RFGQCHWIGLRVSDRIRAGQILVQVLGGRAGSGALREGVLYDLVLTTRGLYGAAEFGVFGDFDALKRGENHGRDFGQLGLQLVEVCLFFAALLHEFVPLRSAPVRRLSPAPPLRPSRW